MKVAVLGAGINGLSCGVKIKEKYSNIDVVIISEILTPATTSDGCGGLWKPYFCGRTPEHLLTKWGIETYQLYHKLWLEGGYDVSMMPLYDLFREETPLSPPEWAKSVFGYNILDKQHVDYLSELHSNKYVSGLTFITFIVWSRSMLAHLTQRFKAANGRVVKGTIRSFNDPELKEYDVIINCLGLGAREVVPDNKVYPVRGQILGIEAPWLNETIFDVNKGIYILPNTNIVIIGGTHQENDFNEEISSEDTNTVANGASGVVPGIKNAKILSKWVGLRPCREEIRLEQEEKNGKLYIHNYGHGGSGLTFFWGCASDVLKIFETHLKKIKEKSKL